MLKVMKAVQKQRDANIKQWAGYVQESTAQVNRLLPMIQKCLLNATGYKLDLHSAIGLVKTDLIQMCAMQKDGKDAQKSLRQAAAAGVGKAALMETMKSIRPKITLDTDFGLLKEGKSPIVEFSIDFVFLGMGGGDDDNDDDGDDEFDLEDVDRMSLQAASSFAKKSILARLKPTLEPIVARFKLK